MKLPIYRRIGLSLLASALLIWTGWTVWARTRIWCPVNMPLSLSENSVTTTNDFTVNVAGPYEIEVEATGNANIPLQQVACSLGAGPVWPEKACATKNLLKASWVLTTHEQIVDQGSSDSEHGGWTAGGWTQAGRIIGTFNAQKGQTFNLRVKTLADATGLSATNPRLRVSAGGTAFEFSLVVTGVLNIICAVLGFVGIVLVLVSLRSEKLT